MTDIKMGDFLMAFCLAMRRRSEAMCVSRAEREMAIVS